MTRAIGTQGPSPTRQRNGGGVADGFVLLALDEDHDIGGG
jgi:hypothetical protein